MERLLRFDNASTGRIVKVSFNKLAVTNLSSQGDQNDLARPSAGLCWIGWQHARSSAQTARRRCAKVRMSRVSVCSIVFRLCNCVCRLFLSSRLPSGIMWPGQWMCLGKTCTSSVWRWHQPYRVDEICAELALCASGPTLKRKLCRPGTGKQANGA